MHLATLAIALAITPIMLFADAEVTVCTGMLGWIWAVVHVFDRDHQPRISGLINRGEMQLDSFAVGLDNNRSARRL